MEIDWPTYCPVISQEIRRSGMSENPYETPGTVAEEEWARHPRPALLRYRTLAAVIDFVVVGLLVAVISYPIVLLSGARFSESGMMFLHAKWLVALPIILLIVPLAYHAMCVARFSATPGKKLMHIKVIHTVHPRISYACALTRYLASCISAGCLCVGYLVAFLDSNRRTFHDRVAGTLVVVRDAE